jgi:hypothetical protein
LIHLRPPELKKSSRTPYATTDLAEQIGDSSPDYGHIAQKQPNYEPIQGPVSIPPTPPAGEAVGEGGGRSRGRLGDSQGRRGGERCGVGKVSQKFLFINDHGSTTMDDSSSLASNLLCQIW